jgi:hypothetical protein
MSHGEIFMGGCDSDQKEPWPKVEQPKPEEESDLDSLSVERQIWNEKQGLRSGHHLPSTFNFKAKRIRFHSSLPQGQLMPT